MTSTRRQMRRGTAAEIAAATPALAEPGYDTTNKRMVIGDGSTAGGIMIPNSVDLQKAAFTAAVAGGTANALTISTARNPSTLDVLTFVRVKITTDNTGAATLAWGSLPPTAIKKYVGASKVDPAAGDLKAGKIVHFDFDGTDYVIFSDGGGSIPAGSIMDYAGSAAPTGWLMCAGQAISRTSYADLYAAIGTTYGTGDGTTTFNLPDLRGRVSAGKDNMGGTAASRLTSVGSGVVGTTLGASGGGETHTLTTAEMPAHTHAAFRATGGSSSNGLSTGSATGTSTSGNAGSGSAHNNVQPTIILNKIIKT